MSSYRACDTIATHTFSIPSFSSFFNAQDFLIESDVDEILLGMASQLGEREDISIVPDLQQSVFGTDLDFSRRDLMSLNIQRGRGR